MRKLFLSILGIFLIIGGVAFASVGFQNNDVPLGSATDVNCGTGTVCTTDGSTVTITSNGGGGAPTDAKYITQTANGTLSAEQALSTLSTGIMKVTTGTGVITTAIANDFPTLNQNTSGTASNVSGTPALPNGTTATTQSQADASTKLATTAYVDTGLGGKQATLVSATNIKTVNSTSLLGSGNIVVTGSATAIPFVVVDGSIYAQTNAGIESAMSGAPNIYLADGTYSLTGDISIARNNVYIKCSPNVILQLANSTNVDMVSLNGYDGVTIDGCTFDGNKANQTTGGKAVNVNTGVTDFTFINNYVHDTYSSGVYSNGLVRGRFLNNRFKDIGKTGINAHSIGMALQIYGTSNDVLIQGNTFDAGLGDGQIFVYGTDTSNRANNVRIVNNEGFGIVSGDEKCCIQNVFSDGAVISGNSCHDNATDGTGTNCSGGSCGNNGVCSFNSDNVTFSNNKVKTVDGTGVEGYGNGISFNGNVVKTCGTQAGYAGLYIGGTNNAATGNKIEDCNVGIQTEGTQHVLVTGNEVVNNTATGNIGIKVISNTGETLTDTTIIDNAIYGGNAAMNPAIDVLKLGGSLTGVFLKNKASGIYADAFNAYSSGAAIANTDLTYDDTLNSGLSKKTGSNVACSATCVYGCSSGYDSGANVPVACATSTAEVCMCLNGE